jgi:alkylated DNA nucleotide flippase Atl1
MADRADGLPTPFAEDVLDLVVQIPEGRVAAYGEIADLLGSGGARAVGTVMARYGADVPWWRVVRADGRPAQGHEDRALEHYRSEGTPLVGSVLTGRRVDMSRARWAGPTA